jgi:hypothetical protein
MSLGNFFSNLWTGVRGIANGVNDVVTRIPVLGNVVKQAEGTDKQLVNAITSPFERNSQTPETYNTQAETQKEGETGTPDLGNMMANKKEGAAAKGAGEAQEAEGAANAAKAAAAEEASAEEMAEMLV